jgi:Cys-tRNA(Pro)/Cys-tRNA(Cys) deacylase
MKQGSDVKKTNAMRILENLGFVFQVRSYEYDENHIDAMHVAQALGVDPETVYKTIILRNQDKALFVFCVPAPYEISLKKARMTTGSTYIDLIPADELRQLTGYIRGGCSPLGMIHTYPTFIEETAQLHPLISISAGLRGMQIMVSPFDLATAVSAKFVDII